MHTFFHRFHFSVIEEKNLEEATWVVPRKRKIIVKKKKAVKLAKKESVEVQDNVHTIKLEIEAIKVKGRFEESFLRFPHIAEQIFETLDIQSLSKCQEVSQSWQKFIFEAKPFFRQLEIYTSISKSKIKQSCKNYDFQTIQQLANCASISYKKALNACIPFGKPSAAEPKGPTLLYYILSEGKLNNTQFLLLELMLLNEMDKSTAISTSLDNQEAHIYSMALRELIIDARSGKFGKAYTSFKHMVIEKQGKWGTIWSWVTILHAAVAQNHLAVCKLIFKQIQDLHSLHRWGKSVLQVATFFGHRDMCELIIDKIESIDFKSQIIFMIDLLADKNQWGENIIHMAERLGHKEICILLESFVQKQE
jgi:hypothetical protein